MLLNETEIEEVYIELREGTPLQSIAEMFDVSYATIQNVNDGKYYQVSGMRYPIVVRRHKYPKEPPINDPFWDSYVPVPELFLPGNPAKRKLFK